MAVALLDLKRLRMDGGTQHRESMNEEITAEYSSLLLDDVELPPVEVVYDGKNYWVWDGFHRVAAHIYAGIRNVRVNVTKGTQHDAVRLSIGANRAHGLRRSNETKRRAVTAALQDETLVKLSDHEIAKMAGVSNHLVRALRSGEERVVQSPAKKAAALEYSNPGPADTEPREPLSGDALAAEQGSLPGVAEPEERPEREPGPTTVRTPGVKPLGAIEEITAERDALRDQCEQLSITCQEVIEELDATKAILSTLQDGGTAASALVNDMKQLRAQLRVAEERFEGAQNERNEAVRLAKRYKAKLDSFDKAKA